MWVLAALLVLSVVGMIVAGTKIFGYDPGRVGGASSPLLDAPAPALDLPVVGGTGASEGDRIALAALRGRVVVLDFWASWCVPCRRSIPALNEVHERYSSRIEMLGINVEPGMPRASIARAHRDFGAHFRTLQDERGEAQLAYQVSSIPTMVIIDRGGMVRWVHVGVPDPDEVADRLDALLASQH